MKISAVIITYNEQKNIARCISSVSQLVDEVVILDSDSIDDTCKIAESLGAKVFNQKFLGHIQQKNKAIEFATNEWILSLDADEALSPELIQQIRELKNTSISENTVGFKFNRLTNYCGQWIKHCGWYPDTKLRLFRKEAGAWGGENPHDKWIPSNSSTEVVHLKGDLLHYSYYTVEEHWERSEKYAQIAAKAALNKGITSNPAKTIVKASAKFVRNYIVKKGFLDGRLGYVICKITAWETKRKYELISKGL